MTQLPAAATVDIDLGAPSPTVPEVSAAGGPEAGKPAFDPTSTVMYQAKFKNAPEWMCSFLASNGREKKRLTTELAQIKGAMPLLMKQRRGQGKWTPEERQQLKGMVRSASKVSPYLAIWVLPGSMLLLPFLAWSIDYSRKRRERKLAAPALPANGPPPP